MKIYVLDGDTVTQNRREWSALVGRPIIEVHRQALQLTDTSTNTAFPSDTEGVVFIHTSYCPPSALPDLSTNYPRLILVALNAAGLSCEPRGEMYWSVGTSVAKTYFDTAFAKKAQVFLADIEKNRHHDFSKLESNIEPILALRLLCEAWLVKPESGIRKLGAITLSAPVDPRDWFAPFNGNSSMEISSSQIAGLMGKARQQVEDFLNKISAFGAMSLKDYEGYEQQIRNLETALRMASE